MTECYLTRNDSFFSSGSGEACTFSQGFTEDTSDLNWGPSFAPTCFKYCSKNKVSWRSKQEMFVWKIQCYVYRLSLVSILTCLCESVKKPYRILSYYVSSQGVQRTWNRIHFDFDLGELTTIPLRSIDFGELPYHVPMLGELGVYTVCSIDEGVDSGPTL